MTDYPHDPELPFVVARTSKHVWGEGIIARFKDKSEASYYVSDFPIGTGVVMDTTPAPKIPADAEFIYYHLPEIYLDPTPYYARRYGNPENRVWELDTANRVSEDDLLEDIGDGEIVVLKRA